MIFNKIKDFFHKVKIGIERTGAESLPYTPAEKRYGNRGESGVYSELKSSLPEAVVVKSVCLDSINAKGEIDYLIIYHNKVFAIELKSWEGRIYQVGDTFYKDKESSGGETYTKELKSPFKQIRRNIYQIKQQFPYIWFEAVVLFQNCDSVKITEEDAVWFNDVDTMTDYIKNEGRINRADNVQKMLRNLTVYDSMQSNSFFGKEESCIIDATSLLFSDGTKTIGKRDIVEIQIEHHFSYDILHILLHNGGLFEIKNENGTIRYLQNGQQCSVAINKVDYIKIGCIGLEKAHLS